MDTNPPKANTNLGIFPLHPAPIVKYNTVYYKIFHLTYTTSTIDAGEQQENLLILSKRISQNHRWTQMNPDTNLHTSECINLYLCIYNDYLINWCGVNTEIKNM